jgi:hypothetical protein
MSHTKMGYIAVYRDVPFCPIRRVELVLDAGDLSLRTSTAAHFESPPLEIRLAELRGRPEADGFDRWAFELRDRQVLPPINLHTRTTQDKVHAAVYATQANTYLFAHVIVRPEDRDFDDCVIFIHGSPEMELTCNRPVEFPERRITEGRKFYWPEMILTGARKTTRACAITVRMNERANCAVYPKSDVGHVPRKIRVVDGRGSFVFSPLGMRKGETAEIKVGFANFSNVASHTVTKQ